MFYKSLRFALALFLMFVIVFWAIVACEKASPPKSDYESRLSQIEFQQTNWRISYESASSPEQQSRILDDLTLFLFERFIDLFEHWYGTAWDFNGTTQTPQEGKIACGYFVSTVLRDIGFDVQRVKMAQQASEKIITSLVEESHIKRFSKTSFKTFLAEVELMGQGIYVVGLDTHVGFMVVHTRGIDFVHSSRIYGKYVKKENAYKSKSLEKSKYRIVGKILGNETLLRKWLLEESITIL